MAPDSDVEVNEPALETDTEFAERVRGATLLLEAICEDRGRLASLSIEERNRLLIAAGIVSRPGSAAKRRLTRVVQRKRRAQVKAEDEAVLQNTGIRARRRDKVFRTPLISAPIPAGKNIDVVLGEPALPSNNSLNKPRNCYVCKRDFTELHHFYDAMCEECAEFNWAKRRLSADLSGRVALVTGSRVKIGYQAAIKLLRAGAHVIVTTRFPADAAARYASEEDFSDWGERLDVYGLDLRHTPSVEAFTAHLCRTLKGLDFIINNACQTVRRPAGFYGHLMEGERRSGASGRERLVLAGNEALAASTGEAVLRAPLSPALDSAELSQVALLEEDVGRNMTLFPQGQLDADLQQVDLRGRNSWRLALDEVSAVELLEVQLVNSVAPFILNARLRELMVRERTDDKHIVNVSAVEGQFYRRFKTDKHPHTNMAKAALNMMTRTSALDYVNTGIHMNSVDTGWVTDEDPVEIATRKTAEHGFHPPLDIVDGAARIVDPIFDGVNTGNHVWGQFLKDYKPTDW